MQDVKYYPMTYTQQRVYFSEKASETLQQGTSMYTIGGCVDIEGEVNCAILEKAIQLMLYKYDAFRIRLKMTDVGLMQYFSEDAGRKIPYFDFTEPKYEDTDFFSWCNRIFKEPMPAREDVSLYYFCIYKARNNRMGYFFKLHHIIADGWSISLLLQTVSEYYDFLMLQNEAAIYEDVMQYSYINYIQSEERYLQSKVFERDKRFWVEKFQEIPEPLFEIHKKHKDGMRKEYLFNSYSEGVLKRLVKRKKQTIPAVISALTAIYFMAYYRKEEIVIGIPVYNRNKTTKKVCGLFTSNALLRLSNRADFTLQDYVSYVKSELNLCYFHQQYPYDLLIQEIGLKKSGRNMLYQVAVNYYNTELDSKFHGMKERNYEMYAGQQFYPLQIVIKDWKDTKGLSFFVDYQTKYFTESQIDDYMGFLENGIYLLNNNPDILLRDIPLITEKGRNELIYGYNAYYEKQAVTETVIQKFENQAALNPDRTAVSCGDDFLSYRDMNEMADSLAVFLQERFGKSHQIIAILASHSIEYIISLVAVLKAGYAFLPIDPEYPGNRILYMLEDTDAAVMLTDQDSFLKRELPVKMIDIRDQQLYACKERKAERKENLDILAYVIYTSGSTGMPKGVLVGHRSFSNYIEYAADTYVRRSEEVFAFFTSIAFDLTITSIFIPLASGIQIRVYQKNKQQYGLYDIVRDNKATIIKLTPSHLMLLNDYDLRDCALRTMILGGENLLVGTVRSTYQAFGQAIDIFNEYGPTEATVGCMTYLSGEKENVGYNEPIGYPIKNTQLYVLDSYYRPLPKGAVGELYIAGECLAYGYLNKPEATEQAFVTHFMDKARKMYKTGDFVRFLDNGMMEYIGRGSDFIKFKGYRIETDEIEKVIQASGYVKSVVVACLGNSSEQGIYAFVTGTEVDSNGIRQYCMEYLPEYMVPQFVETVEQIPLNQNGKTDYKKLEEMAKERYLQCIGNLEQEDKAEAFLGVLRRVFLNEAISLRDNFFAVGGDSIKAIQVSGIFNKQKRKIPVSDILNYPDFKDMYERYSKGQEQYTIDEDMEQDVEKVVEMTPIMHQYFQTLYQKNTYYNQSVLIECHEKTDIDDLNYCLNQISLTHEMLRIRYDNNQKKLIRRRLEEKDRYIASLIMLPLMETEKQVQCMRHEAVKARESISLEQGVVWKGILFQVASGKQYVFLTIHHLCIDGVSWRILLDDLAGLLDARKYNRHDKLVSTDSFLNWARVVNEKGPAFFTAEKEVWNDILTKGKCISKQDRKCRYKEVQKEEIRLSSEQTALLLKKTSDIYHMRMDEILLGILGYCFKDQEQQDNVMIMTESHGRDDSFSGLDTSRTIGWFTSVYPVLLQGTEDKKLFEQLPVLKEQLRTVKNFGIGYGVHKWLKDSFKKETGKTVCFNYLGDFGEVLDNKKFSYSALNMGSDYSPSLHYPYLLEVNAMVLKKSLLVGFSYVEEDMDSEAVHKLMYAIYGYLLELIGEKDEEAQVVLIPSDFSAVTLSSDELDILFDEEDEDE